MQYTTKLKLKKPNLTDYVNIADINENMEIIDTEIAKMTDEETGVEAKIDKKLTTLNEAVTQHLAEDATTTKKGHTQLSDSITSTSTSTAATSNAVKKVNDALTEHSVDDDDAHNRFTDGTTKYKYRFKPNAAKDGLVFVYEEVM